MNEMGSHGCVRRRTIALGSLHRSLGTSKLRKLNQKAVTPTAPFLTNQGAIARDAFAKTFTSNVMCVTSLLYMQQSKCFLHGFAEIANWRISYGFEGVGSGRVFCIALIQRSPAPNRPKRARACRMGQPVCMDQSRIVVPAKIWKARPRVLGSFGSDPTDDQRPAPPP